ncbi:hypothetical protein T440DRAFT_508671 [Plenodomus tracheiphilus IPT5]|uniref:Uncharacterized protein n=1 Tax=Plenodomus tracheiphilus IPT5 TaxID=1408161 RepID=A0A6A7B1W9_9PLEO|nr:hypothetical protein T440DRAFT_508671 [Plenodomus tracheiphilus IPT5]
MGVEQIHLRTRALRALSAENLRRRKITALKKELETLETDLSITAKSIQQDLERLARSECLSLTTQIMTKLPRELRDIICQHLSTRTNERIEREHFRATLDPLTKLYSYNHARWKASHFPEHYWNSDYVGPNFFQELIENYYLTSTFIFGDDPDTMTRFLNTNEFNIPSLPKNLVSKVEIHLNAVSYDRGSFRAYMFGVPKSPERLHEQLEPLFELKQGAKICIHFLTDTQEERHREEHFQAGLEALFSGVQRVKLRGYAVRFVVDKMYVFNLEEDLKREWAGIHG